MLSHSANWAGFTRVPERLLSIVVLNTTAAAGVYLQMDKKCVFTFLSKANQY